MYLDGVSPLYARVGFGVMGRGGDLGYEGKQVIVEGLPYANALSTHPPARVTFDLSRRYSRFHTRVALNDDVPPGASYADFAVVVDGRRVAARRVTAGSPPQPLEADVRRAGRLELVVTTQRWEWCHAVWIEPAVEADALRVPLQTGKTDAERNGKNERRGHAENAGPGEVADCLGRTVLLAPEILPHARRCVATVASPGYDRLLDDMLGSLYANGGCADALVVVLLVGNDPACRRVAEKYCATTIACRPHSRVNATVKAAMYSLAHVVDADQFICLDADMLVLGDLAPVFATLDACPERTILAVREGNGEGWHTFNDLRHALVSVYGGRDDDLRRLIGHVNGEGSYQLVVNDGLFAGSRAALLNLDAAIREMRAAPRWTDERRDIWWRNQFVFNLVLAQHDCGVELDAIYNVQLNSHEVDLRESGGRVEALWNGRPARVLHFNGLGRNKYPEWRQRFARVKDPVAGTVQGDAYGAFLTSLRSWLGQYGRTALAWSFYGRQDALGADVPDASVFPLFGLLHYLIRSNGCARVLETGTARGVSAACLASAVSHRPAARVVTFDMAVHPEREPLWAGLPREMAACIDPREGDSVAGMAAALAAGERYDAALLDSLHTAEHVLAEFELARQLVCPGGRILLHDAIYPGGTVGQALERLVEQGYRVVRLWTASCGAREDDGLGLALVENR